MLQMKIFLSNTHDTLCVRCTTKRLEISQVPTTKIWPLYSDPLRTAELINILQKNIRLRLFRVNYWKWV